MLRAALFSLTLMAVSCNGVPNEGEACDIENVSVECASGQVFFCACPIEGTGECPEDAAWIFDETCTCTSDSDVDCS